jgi:hypothetical protein
MEEKEEESEKAEASEETEEPQPEAKKPIPLVSKEVLLTALAKSEFLRGPKESRAYAWEGIWGRREKGVMVFLSSLAFILLIFFLVGYFQWDGGILPTDAYVWVNLACVCLVSGLWLVILIAAGIRRLRREAEYKTGEATKEDIYFLKDFIVDDVFTDEKKGLKKEIAIHYKDLVSLKESKNFLWLTAKNGYVIVIEKVSFNSKKMSLDTLRGKIQEESGLKFYVSSVLYDPRYDFYYAHNLEESRKTDAVKLLRFYAFFFLLPGLLLNFRPTMPMDCIWAFWVALGLYVGFLAAIIALKADNKFIPKKTFLSSLLIVIFFLVSTLVIGISGSAYNSLTRFAKKSAVYTSATGQYFPSAAEADNDNTSSLRETKHIDTDMYTLYREEVAGVLTDQAETDKFVASFTETGSKWIKRADLTHDQMQVFPARSHSAAADYFLLYSSTSNTFFPTKIYDSATQSTTVNDMYFACYQADLKEVFYITYNIVDTTIYTFVD